MRTQQKQSVDTLGESWGVKQHHWNTEAEENYQFISGGPKHRYNIPAQTV